jgi:hypothetical protein
VTSGSVARRPNQGPARAAVDLAIRIALAIGAFLVVMVLAISVFQE